LSLFLLFHRSIGGLVSMSRFIRFTLRKKIIFACLVCLIVPGYAVFVMTGFSTKDVLIEQAVKDKNKSLELTDNYISNLLRSMVYICNYIQFDTDFTSILKSTLEGGLDQSQEVSYQKIATDKFDNITYSRERTYITVLLPNGKSYTNYSASDFNPTLFFEKDWFERLSHMKAFDIMWLGTIPSYLESVKQKNPNLLTIAKTLKYPSGATYAYVIVSIYEKELKEAFKNEESGEETMLVDETGRIVSHIDSGQIGKPLPYADKLPLGEGYSREIVDGQERLLFDHSMTVGPWHLVQSTPYHSVVGKVSAIYSTNLVAQAALFLLFIFILIYLIRQFTKPIVKLDRIVSKVEGGDLSVRSRIRGNDEIGKLGASFDHMIDRVVEMIDRITEEQTLKRKAELDMLQAQINPHFLFNVLNSIRLKVLMNGDEQNADIIASLSSLLRMTINRNNPMIPLHEELDTVVHYVDILNYRHKDRMDLRLDISSDSLSKVVPRFFLQPLIENAHIHGFQQRGGVIVISSWLEEDLLFIAVQDNGVGMEQADAERLRASILAGESKEVQHRKEPSSLSGIGLRNVYARLKIIYGKRLDMRIHGEPGKGTKIVFLMPVQEGEG